MHSTKIDTQILSVPKSAANFCVNRYEILSIKNINKHFAHIIINQKLTLPYSLCLVLNNHSKHMFPWRNRKEDKQALSQVQTCYTLMWEEPFSSCFYGGKSESKV